MLTLREAAHFFDRNTFTDAYGSATFKGQVLAFPDTVRSGMSSRRRILEVDFAVTIPSKFTVREQSSQQVYIISGPAFDFYSGDVSRVKYPILPVDHVFSIRSMDQVLANSGGVTDAYVSPAYVKRTIITDRSDFEGGYELFFSKYYVIPVGYIVYGDSRYYRTRENSRVDDIGFGVVEAVEIPSPVKVVVFQAQGTVYSPATGAMTPPAAVNNVTIFVEPYQLDFKNESLGFEKIEAGDVAVSFLKSAVSAVKAGDKIDIYRVVSVTDLGLYWTVQGRVKS